MTPLEAARLLDEDDGYVALLDHPCCGCPWCNAGREGHLSECPILAMPQIVKALEAAEHMAVRMRRQMYCNGCGREGDLTKAESHDPTCERWALISAILGEDGPVLDHVGCRVVAASEVSS